MGEYLALAVSLEDLGTKTNNAATKKLGEALNVATSKVLDGRCVGLGGAPCRGLVGSQARGGGRGVGLLVAAGSV